MSGTVCLSMADMVQCSLTQLPGCKMMSEPRRAETYVLKICLNVTSSVCDLKVIHSTAL